MEDNNRNIEVGFVPDEEEPNEEKLPEDELAQKKKLHEKSHPKKTGSRTHEMELMLNQVIAERDEFKDKYLRMLAEVDNSRKRMRKEKEEFQKYVLFDFLLEMLQVLDNLDRALRAKSIDSELPIIAGVEITRKHFLDLLKKYNVVEIDALGRPFDPNIHQALAKEERADVNEPLVIEIYQKGFLYHDKLLRPVLAKVAVPLIVPDTVIEQGH